MFNDTDLMTLRAVQRRLRVPADWLRAEVAAKRLPAVNAGGELLFHYPTLVRLLTDRAAVEGIKPSRRSKPTPQEGRA